MIDQTTAETIECPRCHESGSTTYFASISPCLLCRGYNKVPLPIAQHFKDYGLLGLAYVPGWGQFVKQREKAEKAR